MHLLTVSATDQQKWRLEETHFAGGMKHIIFVGRLLGVVPRSHLVISPQRLSRCLNYVSMGYTFSMGLLFGIASALFAIASWKESKALDVLQTKLVYVVGPVWSLAVCLSYFYMLFRFEHLVKLLQNLENISKAIPAIPPVWNTKIGGCNKAAFARFSNGVLLIFLSCSIIENLTYDRIGPATLETYYFRVLWNWAMILPYNPWITLVLAVTLKIGSYGWVIGDVFVIALSRALTQTVVAFREQLAQAVAMRHIKSTTIPWEEQFRKWYIDYTSVVLETERFVSPLLLSCFSMNIFFVIVNLFCWMAPSVEDPFSHNIYSPITATLFSLRALIVTYFVADVWHVSASLGRILQNWPTALYTLPFQRLEETLVRNPCGISLVGTFLITRKFIIAIVSFVVTTEIVLLQTSTVNAAPAPQIGSVT